MNQSEFFVSARFAATRRLVVPLVMLTLSGAAFAQQDANKSTMRIDDDAMMLDDGNLGSSMMMSGDEALTQEELEFFESKIRPALIDNCYECHSSTADRVRGDFVLDTKAGIRAGGPTGPGVIPGDPAGSLVIQAIRHEMFDLEMPPRKKLDNAIIADLVKWVEMGAPDPRIPQALGETEKLYTREIDFEAGRQFWSFVPPRVSELPAVRNAPWPKTDIDYYVLARMEEHNLAPVRDADKETLIRRLTFDLTGLPPTVDEIEAYLSDRSRSAYENLVNRLLDSPQFGERWGRHWLDVARYAESSGKELNVVYPFAWRYRDYVIDSFNEDKPYDEFLTEQIAGDLLPAKDDNERAENLIATGYLAIGSKSHQARGRAQFAMDLADEQLDAVSQGMLGVTVACARCHDHKFDPIPTTDYYAMAGIFLSTETRYGTEQSQANRHPSELVDLPTSADVELGPSMPSLFQQALQRRLEQANGERARYEEEIRQAGGARNNQQAAQRARALRDQINTIETILGRFSDSGEPNEASRMAMGVQDARRSIDARVLVRGELDKAGDEVPRGFLTVLERDDDPVIRRGSGRAELARWITSEGNPLTARVWANRVWQHLIGNPIVPTPDNFGANGTPPTHPELLDYLAVSLRDNGWSTKQLIREIVMSRTYQLGSFYNSRNAAVDPDNVYLWRGASKRLEGEAIRDAMLLISGMLDANRPAGSPAALTEGVAQTLDRVPRDLLEPPVRSVYLPILRDKVPESLTTFDFAEPSFVTGQRDETTVPSQALYMLNDPMVIGYAQSFAARLLSMDLDDNHRLEQAFLMALSREPTATEETSVKAFFESFLAAQARQVSMPGESRQERLQRFRQRGRNTNNTAQPTGRQLAWTAFCQSLFASAEFRYLN